MNFFKESTRLIKSDIAGFGELISTHKIAVFGVVLITILAYGFEITNFTLSIDEERAAFYKEWNAATVWIGQGRPGITFLKLLFNNNIIVPFWNTFLAVTLLLIASLIYFQAFTRSLKPQSIKSGALYVFSSIFVTLPIHAEYMAFSTYNFEISVGFLLTAVSVLFVSHWYTEKNKIGLILGMIAYVAALSIYQSFIMVFFCGLCIFLVLHYSNKFYIQKRTINIKENIFNLIKLGAIVITGFVIYKIIDQSLQKFYPSSGYIEGFFWWSYLDKDIILAGLKIFVIDILSGEKIFGAKLVLPTLLIASILSFYYLIKGVRTYNFLVPILILGMGFSPFALAFLIGSPTPLRAMQTFPIMIAGIWLIMYQVLDFEIIKKLLLSFVILLTMYQAQSMTRLFYSDNLRYEEDIALANRISERISLLSVNEEQNNTVVFVGKYIPKNNVSIIRSEILGSSFFEWEGGNTYRIVAFMNNLGYDYVVPTMQQIERARELSSDMPEWPEQGSIEVKENIIIVKLAEYK